MTLLCPDKPDIRIARGLPELSRTAAELFVGLAEEAVRERGVFRVCLSGGSTPRALYTLLADGGEPYVGRVPWDRASFFWGDERTVPPDHPDSNYRMVSETLLSKVPVRQKTVFRIEAENPDAQSAAEGYESLLIKQFGLSAGDLPRFDLVLLGMGPDGHTASLFPGTGTALEQKRLVVTSYVEKLKTRRITLTVPVFNSAACVLFLVSGEGKAEALRIVVTGDTDLDRYPAQAIHPAAGRLIRLVDEAAARLL